MAQGLHYEGQERLLQVYFRSVTGPTTFRVRLANSLLLRVTGSSLSAWDAAGTETISGSTSGDTGVLQDKKLNGDGSVTLKLSGVGETEVFSIGETVTGGTSGENGTIANANLNVGTVTNGDFVPNEQIEDQGSGATADIKTTYGNTLEINNISGTFEVGNSVVGAESGATADIGKHYAGIPGLFNAHSVSDIVTEAVNYTPQTIDPDGTSTGWATLNTDVTGDYYLESGDLTFLADGGDLGPINLAVLTVDTSNANEKIISSSPIQGTPPSKVIEAGGNIQLNYQQALGV